MLVLAAVALTALFVPVYRLQGLTWPEASVAAAAFALPCLGLGVLAWHVQTLALLDRHGLGAWLWHGPLAVIFSGLWVAAFTLAVHFLRPGEADAYLGDAAIWQFVWGLLIYAALATLAHVRRRLHHQRLAAETAELAALRAQLNPHFLFNTLHSLTQLSREDPGATAEALERFGGLMRYVLQAGKRPKHEVTLDDEIGFVHDYLALERLRLGDRLRVIQDIDDDALDCTVPPLLLQPLVENAVRHGIAPLRRGGTLRITARLVDGMLSLQVQDDGVGAASPSPAASGGLGLMAVRRQLHTLGASKTRFEIDTVPGHGYKVSLTLPSRVPSEAAP
ncbi:sensor histidine kinase [Piscinibacter gummiphilus]|uniref:histidine kinase n=1 Tax=Piscinibacter gummiphilus TaxID=946333 RepID=A0ABZ0D6B0_9BURK|nr:histidine kinase [Piscinibacter gummiphilus]WOB10214.1 histidine kinase [Piscinibacter gummiphilus]